MQQINQKTLRDKVELQGIGLHNGVNVNLKIKPLKINSGMSSRDEINQISAIVLASYPALSNTTGFKFKS